VHFTDELTVHLADGMYRFCVLLRYSFEGEPPVERMRFEKRYGIA
jgi:hypothetical protein